MEFMCVSGRHPDVSAGVSPGELQTLKNAE